MSNFYFRRKIPAINAAKSIKLSLPSLRPCATKVQRAELLELEVIHIATCAQVVSRQTILPEYDILLVVFGIHRNGL
jgi:hypothetical protein